MAKNESRRARNWCAVVYPDSAPEDWKSQLDSLNVKWACSPLHNEDVDDDGVIKKAHWHIVICYSGNKSFDQVKDDLSALNCPIPQVCRDIRSSIRYFIHKDHPHKFQYKASDIETYGGFDISDALALSKTEKQELFKEIFAFIQQFDIVEYFDLVNICMYEKSDWFQCVTEHSILFDRYLKSNRHRDRTSSEVKGEEVPSVL